MSVSLFKLEQIFNYHPYGLCKDDKIQLFRRAINELTKHHYQNSVYYQKILDLMNFNPTELHNVSDIPFIPVRLFKEYDLLSIEKSEIFKTMTSSGTGGNRVSKIFLDKSTAKNQTKVLSKIVTDFIGNERLPMLIIDTSSVLKNRTLFSARGAGILGFSTFGRNLKYALDENMELDIENVQEFCEKYKDGPILLFGFTFIIWKYFYQKLSELGIRLPLEKAILFHGGGWKKLSEQAVDNDSYKQALKKVCGIDKVHNYYGMVEQTGSIYIECEKGFLHTSIYSDILIRRVDFSLCDVGESGLVQLISLLPKSYPGHNILSEDIGQIIGEDDCPCGRKGKYFIIHGRVASAEIRGCSDTISE